MNHSDKKSRTTTRPRRVLLKSGSPEWSPSAPRRDARPVRDHCRLDAGETSAPDAEVIDELPDGTDDDAATSTDDESGDAVNEFTFGR